MIQAYLEMNPGSSLKDKNMKIPKESCMFEQMEKIAGAIKATAQQTGKPARNLSSHDTATIVLLTVLNEVNDAVNAGKFTLEEAVSEAKASEWRKALRDTLKPWMSAAKNCQNVIMADNGLMEKVTAVTTGYEDIV